MTATGHERAVERAAPLTAIRPDDLAVLTFRFRNLLLRPPHDGSPAMLVWDGTSESDPLLVVDLPPQAVGEEAFDEAAPEFGESPPGLTDPPPAGMVAADYAGTSRLVFALPHSFGDQDPVVEYRLDALLAIVKGRPPIVNDGRWFEVEPLEPDQGRPASFLEMPYRLILSLPASSTWDHDTAPFPRAAASPKELWHSRLAGTQAVHVAGVPDLAESVAPALSAHHRELLEERRKQGVGSVPVDTLMVSSLGGWLDARGDWAEQGGDGGIEAWTHRMTMGRDHYVRVVEPGFLFPLGHKAALVTIVERKLQKGRDGSIAAYLRRRRYLVVRQREMHYQHPGFAFATARLTTVVTPNLLPPTTAESEVVAGKGESAFWPMVAGGRDFEFHVVARDRSGGAAEFATPLAFIGGNLFDADGQVNDTTLERWMFPPAGPDGKLTNSGYLGDDVRLARRRTVLLGRHVVAFAPESPVRVPGVASDSSYEAESVELQAQRAADGSKIPFLPGLRRARVFIPAVRELTGADTPLSIAYDPDYLLGKPSGADVFARVEGVSGLGFERRDQSGGLVSPGFAVTRLSRLFGPLGRSGSQHATRDTSSTVSEVFDPAAFFGDGPKLLGAIALKDLVPGDTFGDVLQAFAPDPAGGPSKPKLPRLVTTGQGGERATELRWDTQLKPEFGIAGGTAATLSLHVVRETRQGQAPTSRATGVLTGFAISVPAGHPLITLPFSSLTFTSEGGKKVDVALDLQRPVFQNELQFVNALSALVEGAGFADPPALTVTTEGIEVGYTLAVPNVAVGVFALQNLALSAKFTLPLVGDDSTRLALAFSERHNPCIVTYSAFGGGAFLGVLVGLGGVEALEGAVEFGGSVGLDLGVASGGVTVMAGIYYASLPGPSGDSLSGFVRCVGALEVLGLIAITVQFFLELRWHPSPTRVTGTASLTVKVEVLFFEESVTLTVQREFAKGGDPPFAEVVDPKAWEEYCKAFEGAS